MCYTSGDGSRRQYPNDSLADPDDAAQDTQDSRSDARFSFGAGAQQSPAAGTPPVDWNALTPQIQAALGDAYQMCGRNSRTIEIGQTADITGDGTPEAIVAYCRQGPYTSNVTLIMLEDGKPVLARFRSSKGKPVDPAFVAGASIKDRVRE